jgi:ketosteroid isomerase-like protein
MSEESTTPDLLELVRKQLEALDRRDLDIRGFLEDWFRTREELDFELEEVSDLGGGVVFAVVIQDGRLVSGDGRLRQREGWVYLWMGGSIARLETSEIDQARSAAERLAEQRV